MISALSEMSNDALLEVLKQSPDATAIYLGPELYIKMANFAMLKLWGKTAQVIGKPFEDALPEMRGQPFSQLLKDVWRDGAPYQAKDTAATLEIEGVLTTLYFDFIYSPIKDASGNTICILHTAQDVTDRVKAWALVREKEELEQKINEDLEAVNEEYKATNEDLAALNEEYQAISEEYEATNEELNEINQRLMETHERLVFTEHRMQELIKTTPIGLSLLRGKKMIIETANPQMLAIWERSESSVIGRPLLEVFPVLKGQAFSESLEVVFSSSKSLSIKEIPNRTESADGRGEEAYWDIDFHPLLDVEGKVDAIMATVQNVTERVLSRLTLEEEELKLQEANEELSTLLEEYTATNEQLEQMNLLVSKLNQELANKNKTLNSSNEDFTQANHDLSDSNLELEHRNAELKTLNDTISELNSKLSDSENGFRNLIAQAPVAILLVKGEDFIITMVNSPMLELLGRREDIIGKALFEEIPELIGQEAADKLIHTFKDGEPRSDQANLVVLHRNGKPQNGYFNFSYAPYTENGKVSGVIDMALEVTAQVEAIKESERTIIEKSELEEILRASEQRLQGILDTMAEGVGITDAGGQLIYANPRAQEILGLTTSEILDRTYFDQKWRNLRIDGSDLPECEHPMSIMMASGKPIYDFEIGVQPPEGDRFYISINAAPIFDKNGVLTGGIGTFMDVTGRRLIAQGKDDFISIASHELKTPVTALKASLQLLQRSHDRLPGESRGKLIDQSIRSLDRLSQLITDLLDASRIEQGQLKLEKSTFSVLELFNNCCSFLGESSSHELIFDGDTGVVIEADIQQIGQVLINFINNSIKYAPGSMKIILGVERLNEVEVKVRVKDFGPGIEKEKLQHLFERYYRTNYQGKKFTGLGLGLYISAEIIKNHGGRIGVDSEMGSGSEFWFILPFKG